MDPYYSHYRKYKAKYLALCQQEKEMQQQQYGGYDEDQLERYYKYKARKYRKKYKALLGGTSRFGNILNLRKKNPQKKPQNKLTLENLEKYFIMDENYLDMEGERRLKSNRNFPMLLDTLVNDNYLDETNKETVQKTFLFYLENKDETTLSLYNVKSLDESEMKELVKQVNDPKKAETEMNDKVAKVAKAKPLKNSRAPLLSHV